RPTLLLDEPVKARGVEDLIQPPVERVARRHRQLGRGNPQRRLLALAFAHRHGPQCTIERACGGRLSPTFTPRCLRTLLFPPRRSWYLNFPEGASKARGFFFGACV